MEVKLFELASKVSKPITLGSITAIILYFVYKIILSLPVFTKLGETNTFRLINSITDKLFILALVSLVLGVISFIFLNYIRRRPPPVEPGSLKISGHVFRHSGVPLKDARVYVLGIDGFKETTSTGYFSIEVKPQDTWVVKVDLNGQTAEQIVQKEGINQPIKLIIPDKNADVLPGIEQPIVLPGNPLQRAFEDPIIYLRPIWEHLKPPHGGRDYKENLLKLLLPTCGNDPATAELVFRHLIGEKLIADASGSRYELTQKAKRLIYKSDI